MIGPAADIGDITPDWLSAALDREVVAVEAERIGTGKIGATYRLTITAGDCAGAPPRLIAKLAAEDPASRGSVADGYRKEVAFYTQLAGTTRVRVPGCWYGAISTGGTEFTLLLDDLAPARPGVQADGCTIDEARAAVRNVAALHAPRWCDPSLDELSFVSRADEGAAAFIGELHRQATEQFVERYRDDLGDDDIATLRDVATATASWLTARPEPYALVHGDYRLDNLMFHPTGEVTAVDWQTLTIGPPLRDVAYLLGTSLDVTDRREHEEQLVATYHDAIVGHGVEGYGADDCFDDYRLGQLQGPLITVLGCEFATAERTDAAARMFLAMATRSCAAIRDLGSLGLVP